MTTATQQIPANPALDFANLVLTETNNAIELIDILHDIAQGIDDDATTHDRITASNILLDRGLGKCPKQMRTPTTEPVLSPVEGSERVPESEESDNHSSDTPSDGGEPALSAAERSRRVTQIKDSLDDSLGPAPSAETPSISPAGHSRANGNPERRSGASHPDQETSDPSSIHFTIQQHILAITNNGRTLFDTLAEIARAKDDPKACPEQEPALSLSKPVLSKAEGGRRIKPSHRARATRILIDRVLGTNTALPRSAPHTEPAKQKPYRRPVRYVDPVKLAEARAEIQRMKDEGILTPDPTRPKIDISSYLPPDDFDLTPYAKEEAAAFLAEVNLRLERQKQWPEIEERRRKKLEQTYPSHSEDNSQSDP